MSVQRTFSASAKAAVLGAGVCAGLGLLLLYFNLGTSLRNLSYDLLFRLPFRPVLQPREVMMIYMDDVSLVELGQTKAPSWDLELHAGLVDHLTADGARVVAFDVVFNQPPPPPRAKLMRFADALRRNRRVVLAAELEQTQRAGFGARKTHLPWEELEQAAAMVGIAEVPLDPLRGEIVRQYHTGTEDYPSLPWAAAHVAGLKLPRQQTGPPTNWLNYYGPALTLPKISYWEATNQPAGFFSNRCVFIGALPKMLQARAESDAFATPHSLLGGKLFPGAEIGATAFLNLLRQDGYQLWPDSKQALLILLAGLVCGGAFSLLRPWPAGAAALVALGAILLTALMAANRFTWFYWTIIAFAEVPFAFAWSIGSHLLRLAFEKEVLQHTLQETTRLVEATKATAAQKPAFTIPDHSLVRLVGRGAYGEVWLARNIIGAYHVVKLVKRRGFPSDEPYEREFRGIQKFMPISRSHPGFVHILHVGRNDDETFFYCIMEAGDDRQTGQQINPDTYQPKTLATELDRTGSISPEAGLKLGLALSDALDHLHKQQLIHRDIKPPNIIYLNGAPKFADIGLVTSIGQEHGAVSQVGTEGYMAPEGPGTPAADVYSLGKVLYEAVMGRDRRLFPEVPTSVFEQPMQSLLRQLHEIIWRACEGDPARRYPSARAMHVALQNLASQYEKAGA